MSGAGPAGARPTLGGLKWVVIAALVLGAAAVLYVILGSVTKPAGGDSLSPLAHGAMSKLQTPEQPHGYPPIRLIDADGKPVDLAALKGKVVVLNLWATWCAPCKTEMPTLAALQRAYAAQPVKVVAISTDDPAHADQAKAFIAQQQGLTFYHDPTFSYMTAITPRVLGLPTTLIFDKSGMERGVVQGETNWSSPEAHAVIDKLLGS